MSRLEELLDLIDPPANIRVAIMREVDFLVDDAFRTGFTSGELEGVLGMAAETLFYTETPR
jgi:hypothetical protein